MDLVSNIFFRFKWKYLFLIVLIAWIIILKLYFLKPNMAWFVAQEYANHIKEKDYRQVYQFYAHIPIGIMMSENDITGYLMEKYCNTSNITIKSIKPLSKEGYYDVTMEITKQNNSYEESFSIVNIKKHLSDKKEEWKVVFPFKTTDVFIIGMDGTRVFIDDKEAGVIRDTKLSVGSMLWGSHKFKGKIDDVGESSYIIREINGENNTVDIKITALDEFKNSIEKLIGDFAQGWSDYCISQNANSIKPYLTDNLFNEFVSNDEMFKNSKYLISKGSVSTKDFNLISNDMVSIIVDEKWHLKEITTSGNVIFDDNKKTSLEQYQYITYEYVIVKHEGTWKINKCRQLEFKQYIVKGF